MVYFYVFSSFPVGIQLLAAFCHWWFRSCGKCSRQNKTGIIGAKRIGHQRKFKIDQKWNRLNVSAGVAVVVVVVVMECGGGSGNSSGGVVGVHSICLFSKI